MLTIELLLPIDTYWEVDALLKRMDYLYAASEDPVVIGEVYQKVINKVWKFAVQEKDRMALRDKLSGSSGGG